MKLVTNRGIIYDVISHHKKVVKDKLKVKMNEPELSVQYNTYLPIRNIGIFFKQIEDKLTTHCQTSANRSNLKSNKIVYSVVKALSLIFCVNL